MKRFVVAAGSLFFAISCTTLVPPDGDGGFDAGSADSGAYDAGLPRPTFESCDGVSVAVPPPPADCGCDGGPCFFGECTLECSECSTLSPCPSGWSCDYIRPPYCSGICRRLPRECPELTAAAVEVTLYDPNCGWNGACRFRHLVQAISDGGTGLLCIVTPPDSSTISLGAVSLATELLSNLSTGTCFSPNEFVSNGCFTHGLDFEVTYEDAGHFSYSSNGAAKLPQPLEAAAYSIFESCRPLFQTWDGGSYSLQY